MMIDPSEDGDLSQEGSVWPRKKILQMQNTWVSSHVVLHRTVSVPLTTSRTHRKQTYHLLNTLPRCHLVRMPFNNCMKLSRHMNQASLKLMVGDLILLLLTQKL